MSSEANLDDLFTSKSEKNAVNIFLFFFLGLGLLFLLIGIFLFYKYQKTEDSINITKINSVEQNNQKDIFIDISGAVLKPGLIKLPEGSRLNQAIVMAGGLLENANKKWAQQNLNLARILQDGQKIYIPFEGEETAGNSVLGNKSSNLININSASATELESLPGIGPSIAKIIIDYRQQNGSFSSIDDLGKISGIGTKTIDKFRNQVTVE